MPDTNRDQTVYVQTGNPDTVNEAFATMERPGELGKAYDYNDRAYQIVRMDSGATSATSTGAPAAGQLAYWKDKSLYLVTNHAPDAVGGQGANSNFRDEIAGVIRNACAAGNVIHLLQRGRNINVLSKAGTYVAGDHIVGDTTSAQCDVVAAGTAVTVQDIGKAYGARSGNYTPVDLDIPNIP